MLDRFQQTIQRYATGRTVLVLLGIFVALVFTLNFTDLPFSSRALLAQSRGLVILDANIGYSPDEAYALFEALGPVGRRLYGYLHLVDLFIPIVGMLFFAAVMAWLLRHIVPPHHPAQRLILFAPVVMLADYAENICIWLMMLAFPQRLDGVAQLANFFTMFKVVNGLISITVILVCVAILVWQRMTHQQVQKKIV
jgi:hypothetical protein